MPAYIIAVLHQYVEYVWTIYNSSVCVFVPFILATSPSDEGETCHSAVYLEDYTDITRTQLIGQRHISPWYVVVRPRYTLLSRLPKKLLQSLFLSRMNEPYLKKNWKNVSCEYNRLNGWNSTLQAAWYMQHQQSLSFENARLPGVWVTYEHQTSHHVTWHEHQHINTNGNMLSFAPDTTNLSGTAEKQHVLWLGR